MGRLAARRLDGTAARQNLAQSGGSRGPGRHASTAVDRVCNGAQIIGWAKPVPVNQRRLEHPRRDFLYIAAAGPASNVLLAGVASVVMRTVPVSPIEVGTGFGLPVWSLAATTFELNLLLAVFNMVPVPPLDGGNVLAGLLPSGLADAFDRFVRPWGFLLLYALLLTGALSALITPPYLFLSWVLTR